MKAALKTELKYITLENHETHLVNRNGNNIATCSQTTTTAKRVILLQAVCYSRCM